VLEVAVAMRTMAWHLHLPFRLALEDCVLLVRIEKQSLVQRAVAFLKTEEEVVHD
jgi:hypothetical protein